MNYYSLTDKGKVRSVNQDNYVNIIEKDFSLFVVADGMGGHNAGEIASFIAVKSIKEFIEKNHPYEDYKDLLLMAIKYANRQIYNKSRLDEKCENMGTTIVACLVADNEVHIAHVGDSRAYYFDGAKLSQFTKDHSYVQKLIDTGVLTEESAKTYENKNLVTNAVGIEENVEISYGSLDIKENDMLLLTTDGLTNLVDDKDIIEIITSDRELEDMTKTLISMANSLGGYDNITLTIVKKMG